MAKRTPRIGIFDSGVGGLTVVRAVRAALPAAAVVYLGDTARVPYGAKSPQTIRRYSLSCLQFLLNHDVDLVLVACNTASANALPALIDTSPVPVIGAVGPGASAAVDLSPTGHIGVIGTLSTVASKAYDTEIKRRRPQAIVNSLACPLLVPLAEEGWTEKDPIATAITHRYLSELFTLDSAIDTLVLGCTHYPLLSATLAKVAAELSNKPIAIVDSATSMARESVNQIGEHPGALAPLYCYVTDASRLDILGSRFLGESLTDFELVDLVT